MLGDEWVYLKIYSGPSILEFILTNEIREAVNIFINRNIIDKFFFIRYSDIDGSHLRVRFRLIGEESVIEVLQVLNLLLKKYVEKRVINKVVYDTYNQEIERYGSQNIEHVETIFNISSEFIISNLWRTLEEGGGENRWVWGPIFIDNLFNQFGLETFDKSRIYQEYYKLYEKEFNLNKLDKKQMALKYRKISPSIFFALQENELFSKSQPNSKLELAVSGIQENYLNGVSQKVSKDQLYMSIMHMHYNRLFKSQQRLQELVMYFIMSKVYKTIEVKNKESVC